MGRERRGERERHHAAVRLHAIGEAARAEGGGDGAGGTCRPEGFPEEWRHHRSQIFRYSSSCIWDQEARREAFSGFLFDNF